MDLQPAKQSNIETGQTICRTRLGVFFSFDLYFRFLFHFSCL